MASTNKTTNYDLSQYVGSDKPTYLTDYNQDMSKIDAGIHAAKSEADTNKSSIGTLSSLTTTAKTNLVAAVNEVDADVATNTNNIATNTSNIATNTTHIGTIANLTTTAKTDLVVAANEINAKVGNIANLETTEKSSTVGAINEVYSAINNKINFTSFKNYTQSSSGISTSVGTINFANLNIAKSSDGNYAKVYGEIEIRSTSTTLATPTITLTNTGLTISDAFTVNALGAAMVVQGGTVTNVRSADVSFNANGNITMTSQFQVNNTYSLRLIIHPCLIQLKSFGDTPTPE